MTPEQRDWEPGIVGVFGRAASTYDRIGPQVFAHFGQRLVERAQLAPGAAVLDVVAGRGAVLFPAAQQVGPAGRVTGIDLSAAMVIALVEWLTASARSAGGAGTGTAKDRNAPQGTGPEAGGWDSHPLASFGRLCSKTPSMISNSV